MLTCLNVYQVFSGQPQCPEQNCSCSPFYSHPVLVLGISFARVRFLRTVEGFHTTTFPRREQNNQMISLYSFSELANLSWMSFLKILRKLQLVHLTWSFLQTKNTQHSSPIKKQPNFFLLTCYSKECSTLIQEKQHFLCTLLKWISNAAEVQTFSFISVSWTKWPHKNVMN